MQSKVAPFAATPDSTYGRQQPAPSHEMVVQAPAPGVEPEAELRLVIEEDLTGALVYRTINRLTGEVVQEFAREEVLRMHEDTAYMAGGVIRTKA